MGELVALLVVAITGVGLPGTYFVLRFMEKPTHVKPSLELQLGRDPGDDALRRLQESLETAALLDRPPTHRSASLLSAVWLQVFRSRASEEEMIASTRHFALAIDRLDRALRASLWDRTYIELTNFLVLTAGRDPNAVVSWDRLSREEQAQFTRTLDSVISRWEDLDRNHIYGAFRRLRESDPQPGESLSLELEGLGNSDTTPIPNRYLLFIYYTRTVATQIGELQTLDSLDRWWRQYPIRVIARALAANDLSLAYRLISDDHVSVVFGAAAAAESADRT